MGTDSAVAEIGRQNRIGADRPAGDRDYDVRPGGVKIGNDLAGTRRVTMLGEVLSLIHAEKRANGEEVPPPATDVGIARVYSYALEVLGVKLPDGYIAFLHVNDGLAYRGTVIYGAAVHRPCGVRGFREANTDMAASGSAYVGYGERAGVLLVWHRAAACWAMVDRMTGEIVVTFGSFDALLYESLAAMREPG